MNTPETDKDITIVEIGHSTFQMVGARHCRKIEIERDKLREGIKWVLMHLEANIDIEGSYMGESDAANALRALLPENSGDPEESEQSLRNM